MKIRKLTDVGTAKFLDWLNSGRPGALPPVLLDGIEETQALLDRDIDPDATFHSRLEFGAYLNEVFSGLNAQALLGSQNDGLWNWLTVAYFSQIGKKRSKYWHYVVTRRGHAGSLAYRHLARASFEMYWRHGENAKVLLNVDMSTFGDASEQLTSRQNVAYHQGFIATASCLYVADGKLKRGAASRLKPPHKRKQGERAGRGNVARLALAVRRLCRTYDTHELPVDSMIKLLPKEFAPFIS